MQYEVEKIVRDVSAALDMTRQAVLSLTRRNWLLPRSLRIDTSTLDRPRSGRCTPKTGIERRGERTRRSASLHYQQLLPGRCRHIELREQKRVNVGELFDSLAQRRTNTVPGAGAGKARPARRSRRFDRDALVLISHRLLRRFWLRLGSD